MNYYGIDTEKENKGIYDGRSVPEVVEELYRSSNIAHVRVELWNSRRNCGKGFGKMY